MKIIYRFFINLVIWQFIFNNITKFNFRVLINYTTAQLLTMSTRNIYNFFLNLIFNRSDNLMFRVNTLPFGIPWNTLCDTNPKRIFWIGFTFTLMIYRQFILFKKTFLWPFKLGIFSFIYSIFGFDVSWFLNLFNFFSINIPHWVYVQYLLLYNNWLIWWSNIVNIKSLSINSLPKKPLKISLESELQGLDESDNKNISSNKKYYIILGVIILFFFNFLILKSCKLMTIMSFFCEIFYILFYYFIF